MSESNQPPPEPTQTVDSHSGFFLIATLFFVFVAIYGAIRYSGPNVVPASVSDQRFSGERAYEILDRVVGDGIPHESGSEQNRVVRERVIRELEALGLEVEQQPCDGMRLRDQKALKLVNLLVRIRAANPSEDQSKTIVALSHYDSKPGAGGAADDGVGVAVCLEVARMLCKKPLENHDVWILITDGEEFGLLGAKGFVNGHPDVDEIDLVINLEARGTSGPSMMFETNYDNSKLIPLLGRAAKRPICSSLFFEIYRRMPNDSDFTVFRKAGIAGYNFAFIGDVQNYHTPNDRVQNVDRKSIQHHGDNLWGLLQELDGHSEFRPAKNETQFFVYFDVLGHTLCFWPSWMSGPMLLVACLLYAFSYWRIRKRKVRENLETNDVTQERTILLSAPLASSAYLLAAALICTLAMVSLQLGFNSAEILERGWVRSPVTAELSFWVIAICSLFVFAWFFDGRRFADGAMMLMTAFWALLGMLFILFIPGGCYLFVVPLLLGSFVMLLISIWPKGKLVWGYLAFCMVVGLFWIPLERMLYDGVGFTMQPLLIARLLLICVSLFPLILKIPARRIPVMASVLAAIGFALSLVSVVVA